MVASTPSQTVVPGPPTQNNSISISSGWLGALQVFKNLRGLQGCWGE